MSKNKYGTLAIPPLVVSPAKVDAGKAVGKDLPSGFFGLIAEASLGTLTRFTSCSSAMPKSILSPTTATGKKNYEVAPVCLIFRFDVATPGVHLARGYV